MTIEEAKKHGCPRLLLEKLERSGVTGFSAPHNLDNIDWKVIESDIDYVMSGLYSKPDPIKTRFEILDL